MSEWLELEAPDGHKLSAYTARPAGEPIGALVLVQEIFGVNAHIRSVADGYAKDGFLVIAPALFDRYERGVELKYEGEDSKKANALWKKLDPKTALLDIAAAYEQVKPSEKKIGILGFCFGGLMSWLSATRGEQLKMEPECCVGYYPGGIGKFAAEKPACPVMLHFGGADAHIGRDQIEAVRSANPEVEIFVYDGAEHAFNRDVHSSYHPQAAALARERTLEFLRKHIAAF
jgi:carboxymethylenebutenolidase